MQQKGKTKTVEPVVPVVNKVIAGQRRRRSFIAGALASRADDAVKMPHRASSSLRPSSVRRPSIEGDSRHQNGEAQTPSWTSRMQNPASAQVRADFSLFSLKAMKLPATFSAAFAKFVTDSKVMHSHSPAEYCASMFFVTFSAKSS